MPDRPPPINPAEYGPGKYDYECTVARGTSKAQAILLIILGGDRGDGFSVQTVDPGLVKNIPRMLRDIADSIDSANDQYRSRN